MRAPGVVVAILGSVVASGCAGSSLLGDRCDWLTSSATPAAREVELRVEARNCGESIVTLDETCGAMGELHPWLEYDNGSWRVSGAAVASDALTCAPPDRATRPLEPGASVVLHVSWNGSLQRAGHPPERAPPGDHVLEVRALDHLDVLRVRLLPNGTFVEATP